MAQLEHSGFSDVDRLLLLVRRTREVLDLVVADGAVSSAATDFLTDTTLPHLEDVQAGFQGTLRSDMAGVDELRYLLLQVAAFRVERPRTEEERRAADDESIAEARSRLVWGADRPGRPVRIERARSWQLAALAHARVVLAALPRLPDPAVRFPAGRRTYADIPTPRGPAELADRIAELETSLWKIAQGRTATAVTDPAFRRTYGFFDAADQLGLHGFSGAA